MTVTTTREEIYKERAEQYFKAVEGHTNGHITDLDVFVAEDVINHNPMSNSGVILEEEHGIEAFRRHAESIPTAFPDLWLDIQDRIAKNDRVVVRFVLSGTHDGPLMGIDPTGEKVTMSGIVIYHFDEGQIVERWGRRTSWDSSTRSARRPNRVEVVKGGRARPESS
ncbi:ester cyclase [Halalkalicoccus salilacus]|uniref:ester cyclase n=1 Tax=Halalkalicoccus sp. GCM10025704 TaxID=3252662 RepID=UPI00360EDEA0